MVWLREGAQGGHGGVRQGGFKGGGWGKGRVVLIQCQA
jgi:hypothetical protein